MDSLLAPKIESPDGTDSMESEMDLEVAEELIDYQKGASESFKEKMLKKRKGQLSDDEMVFDEEEINTMMEQQMQLEVEYRMA